MSHNVLLIDDDQELVELAQSEFAGSLDTTDGVKVSLPEGWVHLRRSNTEPIVRAIAESRTQDGAEILVNRAMQRLASLTNA